MKSIKIILNPVAGHGNGLHSLPRIEQNCAQYGLDHDLVQTQRPWHAKELTVQAVEQGYDVIVAAGGDGTVNEVINGLMQARQVGMRLPALGVMCVGRGNDFSAGVNIPADLDKACQALVEGQRRWIDVGRVVGGNHPEGRYFGNCVGVGFDAVGSIEAAKLPRWGGFLSYLVAVLKTIFLYNKAPLATIEYDTQTLTQRSLMISIMNGRRLGGGFLMAPHAQPDDNLFDLCIAEQMSPVSILRLIPHFLHGTQATQSLIKTAQAARIVITAHDGPLPTQTDGEIISVDGKKMEVQLLPRQIEVVCNPREEMR